MGYFFAKSKSLGRSTYTLRRCNTTIYLLLAVIIIYVAVRQGMDLDETKRTWISLAISALVAVPYYIERCPVWRAQQHRVPVTTRWDGFLNYTTILEVGENALVSPTLANPPVTERPTRRGLFFDTFERDSATVYTIKWVRMVPVLLLVALTALLDVTLLERGITWARWLPFAAGLAVCAVVTVAFWQIDRNNSPLAKNRHSMTTQYDFRSKMTVITVHKDIASTNN